ncbi:TraH family protein [Phyllobacterium sp. YR531]|uniref:TraH family protein n=1 Tax=Phyllobacterium sp. YR531 TaxID=1144343 RepID=UPI00026FA96F|nr:TraH family protein [Phyllobacterium sp. YR531]EJN05984.1 TraH-2 [Phyllobacterium sp. YR531]
MVDAALIQQCGDPSLKPAIMERFIARAGSSDPLAVTVRSGDRVILVPKPATPDEAMELIRHYVGNAAVVRVGITQFPAGLGVKGAAEIKPDLVDSCANIRMGTTLFAKVYRIVTKWYGNPVEEAFEDAIIAWQTGYFEGTAVFRAADPGEVKLAMPKEEETASVPGEDTSGQRRDSARTDVDAGNDPNKAAMRVDLSGIGGTK